MEENQRLLDGEGAVYYGDEAITINNSSWKKKLPVAFILITETLERLAFYGLICNMVLSLNSYPFLWLSYNASNAVMIFMGLSYIITIFGGWLADSVFGKFATVTLFFAPYFLGSFIWTFLFWNDNRLICNSTNTSDMWCGSVNQNTTQHIPLHSETCSSTIFTTLALIAIGYGCVRVNIVPFGAQQVENQGRLALRTYFNWLYWCINVGSFVGFGLFGYIQQNISYFYGYVIPSAVLLLSWMIFVIGTKTYKKIFHIEGSPLGGIFNVLSSSVKILCCRLWTCIKERRRTLDGTSCLDQCSITNGGKCPDEDVKSTKAALKILLIFLCLVPYWTIYYQTQTTFPIQGMHLRLGFNASSFEVPLSWMSLFNIAFVILIVPLMDRVIYPLLDSTKFAATLRIRILIGMVFSILAMVVAGVLEMFRLKKYWGEDNVGYPYIQQIGCTNYYAADMSIFYQIPQYLLIAFGEVFTSIASLEMAYVYSPNFMQSLVIGFYYCFQGIGLLVGMLIMLCLENVWFSSYDFGNINCKQSPFLPDSHPGSSCHLDYYFYTLAVVQLVGMIVFALVSHGLELGGSDTIRSTSKRLARNTQD